MGYLFLQSNLFLVYSQEVKLRGAVFDNKGNPLFGATIFNRSTKEGTSSDLEGVFNIGVSKGNALEVRMIGMKTESLTYTGGSEIKITLSEADIVTDAVVVTGFQEVSRELFTGSSQSLRMEDIKPNGMVDVSRALEGQVAGVNVDNVSGTFGSAAKIRIRGNASILGNNQPLFVVDGVILEDLNNINTDDLISGNSSTLVTSSVANLNPSDIESYEILKDASATAIYGARAANGVIVITTKKGKSGKLRVNYNGNYSMKLRPTYNQFDLLNSAEELSVYRELIKKGHIDIGTSVRAKNYGAIGKMYTEIANHELNWGPYGTLDEELLNIHANANTDWFGLLFNDLALQQQHSLGFTSGSEKSNSYYSVSYLHDGGQTIADRATRMTATARNNYFISDQFIFGLKLMASYRDQLVPGTRNRELDPITGQINRDFDINPYSYSLNTARSILPFNEDGSRSYVRRNYAPFNIFQELDNNYIDIDVLDVSAQTNLDYEPIEDIKITGVVQFRYANTERDHSITENSNQAEAFRANETQYIQDANNLLYNDPDNPGLNPVVVLPQGGFKYLDQTTLVNFSARVNGSWAKNLNINHQVNALAGGELRFTNRTRTGSSGLGVVYESGGVVITDPNIIEFFNTQNIDYFTLENESDRFLGFFVNGGYAFKSKYIANATMRYDGSNQLGRSRQARFLPTWNVSGAWNLFNENWMAGFPIVSDVKLRATYGISGNLPSQTSALLNLQSDVTIRPDDVEPYLFIEDLTNTELTWEKLKEFNVGVDFTLMNRKIDVTMDYYIRKSFDLVGIVQTSGIGGEALKYGNFADMEINGFEFSINTTNVEGAGFKWTTNLNMGYSRDRIVKLDFGPRFVDVIGQGGGAVLGRPRSALYSVKFAGLNNDGIPTFLDQEGAEVLQFDLQERDDLQEILKYEGSTEPQGSGGFTNRFTYKNFSLNILLSYKFGYKIRLNDAFFGSYTDYEALPGDLVNRWAVPGDELFTNVPTILTNTRYDGDADAVQAYFLYNKSTERVANGDYLRLKTIRLQYDFSAGWMRKLGLSIFNLAVEGQNLALLYSDRENLKGQDPEFFTSGGVALPQPRLVTFTLNMGF